MSMLMVKTTLHGYHVYQAVREPHIEQRVKVQRISVSVPCVTYPNVDKHGIPVPNATAYRESYFEVPSPDGC